jgi:hypothetical protein
MEKFIVVANFACDGGCNPDLFANQWLVGTFNTIDECIQASLEDLKKVAKDHYECVLPDDEFEEDEYTEVVAECVENYLGDPWERYYDGIVDDLELRGSSEILSNDFVDSAYTDQRQIVKYFIHKLTF